MSPYASRRKKEYRKDNKKKSSYRTTEKLLEEDLYSKSKGAYPATTP